VNNHLNIFIKCAQNIKTDPASINLAITILNAKKTESKDPAIITGINKIVQYLNWFKTIGAGGNVSYQGKEQLIPSDNEIIQIAKSELFDKEFLTSILLIMNKQQLITRINV
jgi:hypothetical protein